LDALIFFGLLSCQIIFIVGKFTINPVLSHIINNKAVLIPSLPVSWGRGSSAVVLNNLEKSYVPFTSTTGEEAGGGGGQF